MSIEEAFSRIQDYAERMASLRFRNTQSFSRALLMPIEEFEQACLRQAAPHEVSLFQTQTRAEQQQAAEVAQQLERFKLRQSLGPHSTRAVVSSKALGPMRREPPGQATPLKSKNKVASQKSKGPDLDDVYKYLLAAEKLLEIYPLKRARETVERLMDQCEHLAQTQDAFQSETFKSTTPFEAAPLSRSTGTSRLEQLRQAIQIEQMEVIALKATKQDCKRELERLQNSAVLAEKVSVKPKSLMSGRTSTSSRMKPNFPRSSPEREPPVAVSEAEADANTRDAPSAPSPVQDVSAPEPEPEPEEQVQVPTVSDSTLNNMASKVWTTLADFLPQTTSKDFHHLLSTLESVSETACETNTLLPVECKLLSIIFCAFQPGSELPFTFREPPPSILINDAALLYCNEQGQMPMVSMSELKLATNAWIRSSERPYSDDSTTKAIYGLVAKGLFKIDRRLARDPFIFLDP